MTQIIITDAGRAEVTDSEQRQLGPVLLSRVQFGTGIYTPSPTQTALQAPIKWIDTIAGNSNSDGYLHLLARDSSNDAYSVHEFGLFSSSGTLFAVYSSEDELIQKSEISTAQLIVDIALQTINPSSVVFGDVSYTSQPATEYSAGVVELASVVEAITGTDTQRAVTPAGLSGRTATTSRRGIVELATEAEATTGTDTSKAVTPAGVAACVACVIAELPIGQQDAPGLVQMATTAEAMEGTSANKAVAPASLVDTINSIVVDATEETPGIVQLASLIEATQGEDTTKAMTAAGTWAVVDSRMPYGATTMTAGIVELATNPEATAGTDTNKVMTPATTKTVLDARLPGTATTTEAGIIKLATGAEAVAGIDTQRATTPAGVAAAIAAVAPSQASTSTPGLIALASDVEAIAGIDNAKAITSAALYAAQNDRLGNVKAVGDSLQNAGGVTPPDLWPGGTGMLALAADSSTAVGLSRFGANASGNAITMHKSRGASIGQSMPLQTNDMVGGIYWTGDNGHLDYSGISQGAMVASINAEVVSGGDSTALSYEGRLSLRAGDGTNSRQGSGIDLLDDRIVPSSDNTLQLGSSSNRYSQIYAAQGSINTSDEREKRNIQAIPDAVLDAWQDVEYCQYQWLADIDITGARHYGLVAQRILAIFREHGIPEAAPVVHDTWSEQVRVDPNTGEHIIVRPAGSRYGLRYAECLVLEAALMRRTIQHIVGGAK